MFQIWIFMFDLFLLKFGCPASNSLSWSFLHRRIAPPSQKEGNIKNKPRTSNCRKIFFLFFMLRQVYTVLLTSERNNPVYDNEWST